MRSRQRPLGCMVALALACALVLGPGFTGAAEAASEDVAIFYDDLSQYGQWVDYEKYGPVWRPNQVTEDWRPYTDGRWVPTNDGNVFETKEPWGWATYHYGNWMPTEGHGWVWVPGRTWYPSTVEWRTSTESEPVEDSYVGWAPTPPPNYVPPSSFAPASYYQGSPVTDTLIAPLWIFARAASFLLGFGQPYSPAYSYVNAGILVPPTYVPVFFSRTVIVQAYATPAYYPPAFFGPRGHGVGYYNMGPRVGYLSRVTNINQTVINQTINYNSANIARIGNVVPPNAVINRHGYIKQIIPPALAQGRPLPSSVATQNVRQAQVNLNRPNLLPSPQGIPQIKAQIPRVQAGALPSGHGLAGTSLSAGATMPLTPQMTQQIQNLPPQQRFVPAKATPFTPGAVTQPGSGQFQPGVQGQPGQRPSGFQPQTGQGQPGTVTKPGERASGAPAGEFRPGTGRPGPSSTGAPTTSTAPGARKPGTVPLTPGQKGLTPDQGRQQEQGHQRLQRGGVSGQSGQKQPGFQPQTGQRQPGTVIKTGERGPGAPKAGEFRPGTGRPGPTQGGPAGTPAAPSARKPGALPPPPGSGGQGPEHQRMQRGGAPGQPQPSQQQQPRQQPQQQKKEEQKKQPQP